jgi:PKD repeat protein
LKNCQQSEDISIRQLLAPTGGIIIRCTPGEQAVQIKIKNDGINPLTNPKVHYQTDNQPVVDESTPSIAPGDSLIYTFNKKLNINFNGTVNLRIWADYPGEDYPYNDTINVKIPVVSNAAQSVFSESVEGAEFPPSGWIIQNIDNDKSWEKKTDVADKTGNNSTAFLLNCYNYKTRGAEDVLYTIPVSLTSSAKQYLTFDFAHARFDGNYAEQLRVEILSDCSLQSPPVVVWEKTDPELATAPDNQNPFEPTKNDWRSESIDLSSFINQSIIIRFVGVNDYGNNIYLDNISVIDFQQPEAIFTASNNTICRQDTVIFSIPNVSNGVTYAWSFGLGAAPYTTSVSPGPHYIRYATAGTRTVRMILSSPLGKDTVRQLIRVLNLPVANFSVKSNALEIQLTNTSTNATSYLWDFGDNTTSTEANPNHIYSTGGAYNVKLTASNECRTVQQTIPITVSTVGVQDVGNMAKIQILPNPTAGDFVVELESAIYDTGKFYVSDAQGRLIQSVTKAIQPGKQSIAFTGLNLPKGLYQVQVQLSSASRTYSVSVQ